MATKIKNIPFVGGDTQTFEFDFGTKVDGSVTECPMRLYASRANAIQAPTNLTWNENTGWNEITGGFGGQSFIDLTKIQDGQFASYSPNSNGNIAQLMVELDLTTLCNALFGGSNSAMKAAIKNITVAFTALGHGSSSGTKAYSVQGSIWAYNGSTYTWNNGLNSGTLSSSSSSLTAMTGILNNNADANTRIFTDNKIYVLLSTYPSDGTIPSEIDLDYINIKLQFARVPDAISPIPITLPDTWSMLIKGFSPIWDSIPTTSGKMIFMFKKDNNNFMAVDCENPGVLNFFKVSNLSYISSEWIYSNTQNFSKFQVLNILAEQTTTGMRLRVLKNKGLVEKYTNTNTKSFTGSVSLLLGWDFRNSTNAGEAFFNSVIFMPNKTFDDDAEAEAVLRGTTQGFENDELFDISKLPTNSKNIVNTSQGTLTINADAQWEGTGISIPVLPNNKYHFHCVVNNPNLAFIRIDELYNAIPTNPNVGNRGTDFDIITGSKTNNIILLLTNSAAGSVTYSNLSFKLKM